MDCTRKRNSRTTREQFEMMARELKKYPKVSKGGFVLPTDKPYYDKCWKDIASKLNAIGPPRRSVLEWKRVWVDLRSRTKKKKMERRAERHEYEHETPIDEEEPLIVPKEEIEIEEVALISPSPIPEAEIVKFGLEGHTTHAEDSLAETEESIYAVPAREVEEESRCATVPSTSKKRRRNAEKSIVIEILQRNEKHLEEIAKAMAEMSQSVATASNAIVDASKVIAFFAASHAKPTDI